MDKAARGQLQQRWQRGEGRSSWVGHTHGPVGCMRATGPAAKQLGGTSAWPCWVHASYEPAAKQLGGTSAWPCWVHASYGPAAKQLGGTSAWPCWAHGLTPNLRPSTLNPHL
eukprot:364733-Chlamydomonas_euryale.AAC.8